MRKAEQQLWDTMKRHRPPRCWMNRIENLVGAGIPDVLVMRPGYVAFVELKAPTRPKFETTALLGNKEGLNPSQINWHLKAAVYKVNTFIVIRDDQGALFIVPGSLAHEANKYARRDFQELSLAHTWKGIYKVLNNEN